MALGCRLSLPMYQCPKIDAFRPAADFKQHMDKWITRFKQATPISVNQPVLIPGDPERAAEADRLKNGIPLLTAVVEDLKVLSDKFEVPWK
jgi:L-2-hydroxycarboxylate dehydrogenase (NAD+)